MVAHLDAVTSLAVDPNGLYLMSGSKYSRTRHANTCNGVLISGKAHKRVKDIRLARYSAYETCIVQCMMYVYGLT